MPAATPYSHGAVYDFFVDKLEKGALKLLHLVVDRIEEPTKETTNKHNTHLLIDLRDWFLAHETCRTKAYRGLFNFVIIKYDRDNHHGDRWDALLEKWKKMPWLFSGRQPKGGWLSDEEEEKSQASLLEALSAGDSGKVMNLIE